eukprot:TRINITY_DN4693_c0_g3_i3.p1 TRINITY_DN4693_c0_g3~~TRINITY_DN4693_c0_g3_i3.p1  ORF type:complete len:304 (-),score=46.50 TRINITY_DN4693_c0_g3_i3:185-1096(-)
MGRVQDLERENTGLTSKIANLTVDQRRIQEEYTGYQKSVTEWVKGESERVSQMEQTYLETIKKLEKDQADTLRILKENMDKIAKLQAHNTKLLQEEEKRIALNDDLETQLRQMSQMINQCKTELTIKTQRCHELESINQTLESNKIELKLNPAFFNDTYDVIVKINSVNDLINGWKVEVKDDEKFEAMCRREQVVVAVVGHANKGKTYVANGISGKKLQSGFQIKTEGLSLKYSDEGKILALLDTEGSETPLHITSTQTTKDEEKPNVLRNKLSEKLSTEDFLQSFILENCKRDTCVFSEGIQ